MQQGAKKAHYLEEHIQLKNTVSELCSIHCSSNDEHDLSSLFKETIRKLKCLMTDRASVMKCFDKKLVQYKYDLLDGEDCSTHFIYFVMHIFCWHYQQLQKSNLTS